MNFKVAQNCLFIPTEIFFSKSFYTIAYYTISVFRVKEYDNLFRVLKLKIIHKHVIRILVSILDFIWSNLFGGRKFGA